MSVNVLYLVTARGGSKGVPGKNITNVGDLPLIAYKIISAKKCRYPGKIVVSTDDPQIAEVAKAHGAEVPFWRPKELATDSARSIDVVLHAMEWVENNSSEKFDIIFVLEPSAPFGTHEQFNEAIDILISKQSENVVSVRPVEPATVFCVPLLSNGSIPELAERVRNMGNLNRQNFVEEVTPSGSLYCSWWQQFIKQNTARSAWFYTEHTYTVKTDKYYGLEIDSPEDLELARWYVESGKVDKAFWNMDDTTD